MTTGTVLTLPPSRMQERWLSKRQVAEHYGRSPRWVELRVREGMPSRMIGGRRAFQLSAVDRWLEERFG